MKRWLLHDPDGDYEWFSTREEAVTAMRDRIDHHLVDGRWEEEVEELCVVYMTDTVDRCNIIRRTDYTPDDWSEATAGSDCDECYDYRCISLDEAAQ